MEEFLENTSAVANDSAYNDTSIVTMEGLAHIRLRPGMYIGKLGDGSFPDDGIYMLLKEIIDNSVDEFRMKYGNRIDVNIDGRRVTVRDYGRGIPLNALQRALMIPNTSGKFDSKSYKKSVGLNGVGAKAVNALSLDFEAETHVDGSAKIIRFHQGVMTEESEVFPTGEKNGTRITFTPDDDPKIFGDYHFDYAIVEEKLRDYCYLNPGLNIVFNGNKFNSKNGLLDLLNEKMTSEPLYPIAHLKGDDIEIAFTHTNQYGEEYYSFVNGQHTTQGGTHQSAFREALARTIKEFFNRNVEFSDIRNGLSAAISLAVQEPVFESQTKIKLGSRDMGPDGPSVAKYVGDFVKKEVDNYLHRNPQVAEVMLNKILESEKERKAIAGVSKVARERSKKANLHNRKLRDCRFHFNEGKDEEMRNASSIFITEGDSASGSITTCRDVNTQAVFSLRGKPFNSYGHTKKIVYENEELNLLQAALNIEDGMEGLRYNKVIIATDADDDGMHIRMLLLTFFLQFFPDLVKSGHVYILQTPLFRVRDKKETFYCYTDEERIKAIKKLGDKAEITRFKGLGEISSHEFKHFIDKNMRLDPVSMRKEDAVDNMLRFYMGGNNIERQQFIIENLRVEDDTEEELKSQE
ncbi:MAG: ATP-binding protein [Bacteroidetes bacterium]|uniref:DNA topoisomerase (ATP-hydrolyzing) n=1 Tax=Candidatus Enterocola intestinipullorum TaxID=2840783 RepID=A0A9D9EHK2_9BACT|nr:ATP-binding protein [Candidatus Enterocola intestinipullorum]